jgi:phosphatidylinositol alpha-1,6-mannosyltransferase
LALHYVIAGIGEDAEYLDSLIREHHLQGVVHLIGAVSDTDLPRWMNACDVFAMPNREINGDNEGFGMVFIEAAACGKPCLAGMDGGTGAAVKDRETGLRVNGKDTSAVIYGLRTLILDPDFAHQLGEQGYQRVHADFVWERVAEKTTQINLINGS